MIDRLLQSRMREILVRADLDPDVVDELVDVLVEATLPYDDLLDEAWRLLANVSQGDWKRQTSEWQMAVHRFAVKAGYRQEHP